MLSTLAQASDPFQLSALRTGWAPFTQETWCPHLSCVLLPPGAGALSPRCCQHHQSQVTMCSSTSPNHALYCDNHVVREVLLLTHFPVEKTEAAGSESVTDPRSQRGSNQLTQSVHLSSVERRLHVQIARGEVSKYLGLNSCSDSRNLNRGGG